MSATAGFPVCWEDVVEAGAKATREAAPVTKHYCRALGMDRHRASKQRSGSDPYSPGVRFSRALLDLERLARAEGTSAWPILTHAAALVRRTQVETRTVAYLEHRIAELTDRMHDCIRDLNRANVLLAAGKLIPCAEADERLLTVVLERAALLRERASRKVGEVQIPLAC